mmetsp:Transcript_36919/g.45140  ORF Transcript_36919/g.45140 Transcript_36919/m.45140 type:complete len:360 (+) Transcript_36919:78-1157(+)
MSETDCQDPLFDEQQIGIFITLNAISGLLSIVGSTLITFIILRDRRKKLSRVHNRLILSMSVADILNSSALGLSIVPTPSNETSCSIGMGNVTTCTIQGFFLTLGLAVPHYTAMLSIYYFLKIRYQVKDTTVEKVIELVMHVFSLGIPFSLGIAGVMQDVFFGVFTHCWFADKCGAMGNCPEGHTFGKALWFMVLGAIGFFILLVVITTSLVGSFLTIRKRTNDSRRHRFEANLASVPARRWSRRFSEAVNLSSNSSRVAKQSALYVLGFVVTYIWTVIYQICFFINGGDATKVPISLHFLAAIFLPLQGFWNFVIYTRPRVEDIQIGNPEASYFCALKRVIFTRETQTNASRNRRPSY